MRKPVGDGSSGWATRQKLSTDSEQDSWSAVAYTSVSHRKLMANLATIITFGLFKLLMYWLPYWEVRLTCKKVALKDAELIVVEDTYKGEHVHRGVCRVHELRGQLSLPLSTSSSFIDAESVRYFTYHKVCFVLNEETNLFVRLVGIDGFDLSQIEKNGITNDEASSRRSVYGENSIEVAVHSVPYLLVREVLNPYYVFQVFAVTVWLLDEYYYYSVAIVIMSVLSIALEVYETRRNEKRLRDKVKLETKTQVIREDKTIHVDSRELVPGDLIEIPRGGCEISCDALIVSGQVVVNEAMLTGEAVPITKVGLEGNNNEIRDFDEHLLNKHLLFSGTKVLQTRSKTLAIVIRTGFSTTKGRLVRSILYPLPADFVFEKDSYKFVASLFVVALIGFLYSCFLRIRNGEHWTDIALRSLDLITIAVPPVLPAAMTIGIIFSQSRLKQKLIFCTSPRTINVSGSVDLVCFDKTGTLTQDGLDFHGLLVNHKVNGQQELQNEVRRIRDMNCREEMVRAMASCHSLAVIDDQLRGDPIDLKMFEATKWELEEHLSHSQNQYTNDLSTGALMTLRPPTNDGFRLGQLRQFPFSSSLQRMSVVVSSSEDSSKFMLFTKGAPETIRALCKPESVPVNIEDVLKDYTERGYRVIAMAKKEVQNEVMRTLDRKKVESDLHFLGLIVFDNKLKKVTKSVIRELEEADLRTMMITGDNINTAVSVARECNMICGDQKVVKVSWIDNNVKYELIRNRKNNFDDSNECVLDIDNLDNKRFVFAMEGITFSTLLSSNPSLLEQLLMRSKVLARTSPDEKQRVLELLHSLGYSALMCGDGANDCGALRAAQAGISLSQNETSVAAPFTSTIEDIGCVPKLIREGRCALTTSFGVFKYVASYSLIQFTSVILLYHVASNLADWQFLYIDLGIITVLAALFGRTHASEAKLSQRPPQSSLVSLVPLSSMGFQLVLIIVFQLISFLFVQQTKWFVAHDSDNANYANTRVAAHFKRLGIDDDTEASFETYAVFAISSFQYIVLAVVYSKAEPYRKHVYTNRLFSLAVVVLTLFNVYLVLRPAKWIVALFELLLPPEKYFRYCMLVLALIFAALSFFVEDIVVDWLIAKKIEPKIESKPKQNELKWDFREKFEVEEAKEIDKGNCNQAFQH